MAFTEEDKRELLEEIKKASIVVEDQPRAKDMDSVDNLIGTKDGKVLNVPAALLRPVKVASEEELDRMLEAGECEAGKIYYTEEES